MLWMTGESGPSTGDNRLQNGVHARPVDSVDEPVRTRDHD